MTWYQTDLPAPSWWEPHSVASRSTSQSPRPPSSSASGTRTAGVLVAEPSSVTSRWAIVAALTPGRRSASGSTEQVDEHRSCSRRRLFTGEESFTQADRVGRGSDVGEIREVSEIVYIACPRRHRLHGEDVLR